MVPSRTTNHQYGTNSIFSCNFSALSLLPSPGCKMDLRNASTRVYQFCLPIDSSHLACISLQLTIFPRCNHIELPTEPLKNSGNGGHPVQSGTKIPSIQQPPLPVPTNAGLCSQEWWGRVTENGFILQFNNHKDGDS